MHTVSMILMTVGAVVLFGVGLVSVLHDLLVRGPHDAPLMRDKGLACTARYQGCGPEHDVELMREDSMVETSDASCRWNTTGRDGSHVDLKHG